MKRGLRIRAVIAGLGIAALVGVGASSTAPTEAAWTEPEVGKSPAITAGAVAAPTNATCTPTSIPLLGLQRVKLTWSSQQQGAQRIQIERSGNIGTDVQGTTGSAITQIGASGGTYQYEATYDTAKLLGLINLSELLGGEYTIRIFNGAGENWVSAPKTYTLTVVLLALTTSCK